MDRTVGAVRFLKESGGRTHQERTRPKDVTGGAEMKDKETGRVTFSQNQVHVQGVYSSEVPLGGTKSGQREAGRARSQVALLTPAGAVGRSPPLPGHMQRARLQGSGEFSDVSFTIREAAGKSLRRMRFPSRREQRGS